MSLTDFFRVNLPYGMKKTATDEWFVFNREYVPIGWNQNDRLSIIHNHNNYNDIPVKTKYKAFTDKKIEKIIKDEKFIHRNEKNEITEIFFYNDKTNPQSSNQYWEDYFAIIKELSKLETK